MPNIVWHTLCVKNRCKSICRKDLRRKMRQRALNAKSICHNDLQTIGLAWLGLAWLGLAWLAVSSNRRNPWGGVLSSNRQVPNFLRKAWGGPLATRPILRKSITQTAPVSPYAIPQASISPQSPSSQKPSQAPLL